MENLESGGGGEGEGGWRAAGHSVENGSWENGQRGKNDGRGIVFPAFFLQSEEYI